MSKLRKCLSAVVLALACAGLGYAPDVAAAVPAVLTQQGRLLDAEGNPVDADVSFVFSIYDAATGGTALWTETQSITVDQGYFSARIGDVEELDPALFTGAKTLYLGVQVGSDDEMTPRQAITSVPYALKAGDADRAALATLATNATNATRAAMADTATSATSATNATNATTAAAVTSIAANFSQATATGSNTTAAVTAACAAGYTAIAGGCRTNGAVMVSGFVKNQPAQYQCQCNAACTLTTQVVCAR